jgi:arylsulfatase A-like enzyme
LFKPEKLKWIKIVRENEPNMGKLSNHLKMKFINPRTVLFLWAGSIAFIASGPDKSHQQSNAADKPNIIVIIPDDLGWADVGYNGSAIKTPNIDKLVKSGVRLDQHYVMPTCTPSRVSLMTGRYPSRYGITAPAYGEVIDLGDPTLASLLGENGYYTSISGKWHMGSPPYTPLKYGFQSSYGFFDGQIDPYTHEYKTETELTSRKSWHRNDKYLDEDGHATDLLTQEALRVIEGERDQPFFLYLAYSVPHYPLDEPEEWTSLYDHLNLFPSRKWNAASITHMDDGIGKIIDALDRTGQRGNTLILFISDNGGQKSWHSETEYQGKYADKPHLVLGNNYPLRGWKTELYEGGIRVPAFANWPGRLKPGSVDSPIHIADWLPTLCVLTGGTRDLQHLNLDGRNIWPLLSAEQPIAEPRVMYWKTSNSYAVREGSWKLLVQGKSETTELYNLENDFRETENLSEVNPDKIDHLMQLLERFKKGDRDRP